MMRTSHRRPRRGTYETRQEEPIEPAPIVCYLPVDERDPERPEEHERRFVAWLCGRQGGCARVYKRGTKVEIVESRLVVTTPGDKEPVA